MFRFLLSRRWLTLLAAVIVMGLACVALARWQFHRYHERKSAHDHMVANLQATPLPAADLFSPDQQLPSQSEWRTVTATGHYDTSHQFVVLYRNRGHQRGVDVVVPLMTRSGTALLVDRGFVAETAADEGHIPDLPAAPTGTVTVTGWARAGSTDTGDSVRLVGGAVRAISADALKPSMPYPLYDGWVALTGEKPSVSPAPKTAVKPDSGWNTSFFYAIQWLFFALLFISFWVYFAWSEYKQRQKRTAGEAPDPDSGAAAVPTVRESDPRPPGASHR